MKRFFFFSLILACFCGSLKAASVNDIMDIPAVSNESLELALNNAMVLSQGDSQILLASFLASESQKFGSADFALMTRQMKTMSESQLAATIGANYKDPTTSLILSILIGGVGVDRFYVGDTGLGVAKLLTGGGLGVWWIVDMFVISNRTKVKNYKEYLAINANAKLLQE